MMTEALQRALRQAVEGRDLDADLMERAMATILRGEASDVLVGALAIALRMKGETVTELAAAARAMRQAARRVVVPGAGPLVDTCGTGGDGSGSFNVSTVAALVVASCGVRVAKHGNRAVSSRAGSADLLEALGVSLDADDELLARQVQAANIAFLFAPAHHGALRHAAPVRRALGLRTFFNLLGPLSNPAGATHQLVGVYDPAKVETLAAVFGRLGSERVWVVHGEGGLDEISPLGPTQVAAFEPDASEVRRFEIHPADFGLSPFGPEALAGGDAEENAAIARRLLAGDPEPRQPVVLMNAAAALVVAGAEATLKAGYERARQALVSGDTASTLAKLTGAAP